ncbi:MAG: serine/threonine-protein phosphatase [Holophagaceae bacterium]|nr:serine/threonine-protein phosphatase [Holophagaceae bacterium]
MTVEFSPFERLRDICLSTPQGARELLPLIDFLEAFPEQLTEEELAHLVGVTALGIAKTSHGGLWDKNKWLFQRGTTPDDPSNPGDGWSLLPWGYLDELFGYLVVKGSEQFPTLELLLSISAPLYAGRRLETKRVEQNRKLALQINRLNTLFDMTKHLGMGEPEGKRDVLHHFANTLAGEFMIQRVLVLDENGTVLLGRGLGIIPDMILGEVLQDLINAKKLSHTAELKDQDNRHGYVYVANPPKGNLNEEDHLFLQTLLNITASHLSALDMRESRIQTMKLEKDMELARNIQRKLLPQILPEPPGWQCTAANLPFEAVGGDLYDLWVAEDGEKGDRLHLLVGDISGKGLPAALMMTQLSAYLRAMADRRVNDWGYLASRLNARMNEVRERNRYTTLFAASFNPSNGDLRYLNGGHNPPILIPGDGGPVRRLNATGPVIGLIKDVEFNEGHEVMAPGDVLLAFTDGLVEAEDVQGIELGDDRVVYAAKKKPDASADEIFEQILVTAFGHIRDSGFRDDATLLVIRRCR